MRYSPVGLQNLKGGYAIIARVEGRAQIKRVRDIGEHTVQVTKHKTWYERVIEFGKKTCSQNHNQRSKNLQEIDIVKTRDTGFLLC